MKGLARDRVAVSRICGVGDHIVKPVNKVGAMTTSRGLTLVSLRGSRITAMLSCDGLQPVTIILDLIRSTLPAEMIR
jgi:hypothetical protein